jgi:uncharacterized protein YndB with AHSA1/START domain
MPGYRTIRMAALIIVVSGTTAACAPGHGSATPATAHEERAPRLPEIRWPIGFLPADGEIFAHNERSIRAPCATVFRYLVEAERWERWYSNASAVSVEDAPDGELHEGSVFRWKTFGLEVESRVNELVPASRLAWFGKTKDIDAYHTWDLAPVGGQCRVVTEEVLKGPGASSLRRSNPNALHDGHELWLRLLDQRATTVR